MTFFLYCSSHNSLTFYFTSLLLFFSMALKSCHNCMNEITYKKECAWRISQIEMFNGQTVKCKWTNISAWPQECFTAITIYKANSIIRAIPMSGIAIVTTQFCLMPKCTVQVQMHYLWNTRTNPLNPTLLSHLWFMK